MATSKYQEWLEADNLILLEGWARDGLTDEQIAHNMGISAKTLWQWKKKYSKIGNALKKSKDIADFEVENALFNAAKNGNVTAQIYWLNNRKPDRWRNKQKEITDTTQLEKLDNILEEIKADARSATNAVHN